METIFDHNVTKEELRAIFGPMDWTQDDFIGWSENDHLGLLYVLYSYRGDSKKANMYAKRIPNTIGKVFGLCNHDFAT